MNRLRRALLRLFAAEPDYTRFVEHHGGSVLRRARDYERYLDELDNEWVVRLPSGMVLPEAHMHSLLVNISRDLEPYGTWELVHDFVILPAYGGELVDLLTRRLTVGLPAGWRVQVRHCDPDGRDIELRDVVATGKGLLWR